MADQIYQVNIFDYLRVLKKRVVLIISLMIIFITIGAIITINTREQYVASASILLTEARRGETGFGLGGLGQSLSAFFSPASFGGQYDDILRSRMMAMRAAKVLGRTDYAGLSIYQTRGREVYKISCRHPDRKFAAQMVNAYVEALYKYEQENARLTAAGRTKILEEKLAETDQAVNEANARMVAFQRQHRALNLAREADIYVNLAIDLKRDILTSEAELEAALKTHSPNHPDIKLLQERLNAQKTSLAREIENALYPARSSGAMETGMVTNVAEKALKFARLQRDAELQNRLYGLLQEEYQKNKISEEKKFEAFRILDLAVPPRHPTFPNPKQNVFLGAAVGLIVGIILSFFLEYLEQARQQAAV